MHLVELYSITPLVRAFLRENDFPLRGSVRPEQHVYTDGFRYWFYNIVTDEDAAAFEHMLFVQVSDRDAVQLRLMMG